MKELRFTRQFKKDLKKFLNKPKQLRELKDVLDMLKNEIPLPEKYKQHQLSGEYKGCLECHIEGDFLLIWYDEESNTIALFRLGSHSELFKK
ncbi:type II toxin-antitoxin system YafQ family toxin [uncultured Duncaniella sp.]|uniref:type II toxin-antitoxin system RelE/ParE family toxin n=1 Tax=uncultured Duncaniella sp. TaxID=2768039 RepID=UPI0025DC0CD6|nr:type II toxin-antitoxin system YafQ family toxin [uncultured Duncaniella sp.]